MESERETRSMRRSRKPSEDSDNDDERKRKRQKTGQQQQQQQSDRNNWSHPRRKKAFHNNYYPSRSRRDPTVPFDRVHSKVSVKNSDPLFVPDAKADTVSVGRSQGEPIISGNAKERGPTDSNGKSNHIKVDTATGKQNMKLRSYGTAKGVAGVTLPKVKSSVVYKKSQLNFKVIEQNVNPKDNPQLPNMMDKASDNAAKHAEMKTPAYCKKNRWAMQAIGFSRQACRDCHRNLNGRGGVARPVMRRTAESRKVTNWRKVGKAPGIDRKNGFRLFVDSNIPQTEQKFTTTVKNNLERSVREFWPGASVGLISGTVKLARMIRTGNVRRYSDGGTLNHAKAGSTPGILGGQKYYARAAVADARIGLGDVASIGASALSARAYAQYGWTNSVGLDASIVRVDGNIGPVKVGAGINLDTHASIGVNGISASLLGVGFSAGLRYGIQTPFFDFNITLF